MTKRVERELMYGPILRRAFQAEGLPGHWGMALARQESNFQPQAQRLEGGDGARGGSFGLCQMSLKTAQGELGYLGNGDGLKDPELNAKYAAQYFKIIMRRFHTEDLKDIAAAYNSGRVFDKAPSSTRTGYVPLVLAFADYYSTQEPTS